MTYNPCYSMFGPWTSNITSTQELVRNAKSGSTPDLLNQNLQFQQSAQVIPMHFNIWEPE